MPEHANLPPARRDEHNVPMRPVLIGGVLLGLFVFGTVALAKWMYPQSASVIPLAEPMFPQPRLQAAPSADYAKFHREQNRQLDSAAWADAAHQTVRVPIADSMAKLARVGIADWPVTARRQQP